MLNAVIRWDGFWGVSASEVLSEQASEETGSVPRWPVDLMWKYGASEILSEEASEETGSASWPPFHWFDSASEILDEQVLEESGQSTDDF